jgi:pseudaminic acid cytidylyltransferase
MKVIALIPARGGSKRLPRKNITDFYGKPLIVRSIESAIRSNCFDEIVVSTEDREIAEISRQHGARVVNRSQELSTDSATVKSVCLDFLEQERQDGRQYDVLSILYAAAPLRNDEDIKGVVNLVVTSQCNYALATTHYSLPPLHAFKKNNDGFLNPMWPEYLNIRESDFPELEVDNGSVYAVNIQSFLKEQTFTGTNTKGYFVPELRSIDIDTIDDLNLAKLLYSQGEK